ncbi:MAG: ATP-grasp domain-containing protein [Magnetococcales bacterium]|nr:ATP-grasp domain-containing protein [Magnetococcales bacterium]MBF0322888.1 ATP-grasp domain-containing protein [Magnetococcales bacterium]
MIPFKKGHADWRRWTIGITGMNARPDNPGPGLAVGRCLREVMGFTGRLVGLGYEVLDPGLYSGAIFDAGYLLPYPSCGSEGQLERLLEIHAAERLDVVIPCLDAELSTFAHNEALLAASGMRMLLPTLEQLRERAKDNLGILCRKLGLDTPETQKVSDVAFFDRCRDEGWEYPLVVKGVYYDAVVADTPEEAKSAFHRIALKWGYPLLVQKFVGGYEINLTAVGDGRGEMLGPVMMRKRALTDKGKAWAGISIDDQELEELGRTIISGLRWRGPLEVEALRATDGRLYLIEINPRFPAWVYLTHGVGCNLPQVVLRLLADDRPTDMPRPRPGTLFIRYAEELITSLEQFQAMMVNGVLVTPCDKNRVA